MNKNELVKYLNEFLKHKDFDDKSKNWLQVDSFNENIKKIGYSVDASSYIFDKAIKENVDMVLVHHWIFWWIEETLVWVSYKRIKKLIDNNISLYVSHLPLDAHEKVWNNIGLLNAFIDTFKLRKKEYEIENFWEYQKQTIWFWIKLNKDIFIWEFLDKYTEKVGILKELYNFWNKETISSVAFISWWALRKVDETYENWYDLFVTWEWVHNNLVYAKELWQSILLWWHYETEKIWPKLLAEHIEKKFGIEIVFLDEKY